MTQFCARTFIIITDSLFVLHKLFDLLIKIYLQVIHNKFFYFQNLFVFSYRLLKGHS